ncbi:Formylglycine-generating enzyme required for sulfatase/serine/threonine protein kinase [Balamuthia mandrillaris]
MKAVWKNSNNEKEVKHLRKEHAILNSLSGHPNIIRVYSNLLEDKHKACFIMEYAEGGDLFDYTLRQHHLTEVEAWRIFHQLIKAVAFIHANYICHRDIKPENIFLDRERQVKLGDFGLATTWSPFKRMIKTVGSLPEVLRPGQSYTGPEVDMWSCGVVLYMMLTGKMPFHAYSDMDVYQNITAGHYDSSILPSETSRNLVESLLEPDPLVRSTIYEVINHEWMMSPPGLHRAMSLPEIHNGQSVELRATQKTHPSTPSSASSKSNKREQGSPRKRDRLMASRLNVIMEEEQ